MIDKITIKKGAGYYRYYVMDGARVVSTSGQYATLEQCISSAIADFPELSIPDKNGNLLYEGIDYFELGAPVMPPGVVGDGKTDDYFAIKELIGRAPQKSTIDFPDGNYYISDTLRIINKGIRFRGQNDTNFICAKGGFFFERQGWSNKSRLRDLNIITHDPTNSNHGVEIHMNVDIEDVNISNFKGWGVWNTGDINDKTNSVTGTDASRNHFRGVEISGTLGGFYFQGGDSSANNIIGCSVRDTDSIGFFDHGFLGNYFHGCMGHANKWGHYRCDDGNARSVFVGCYGEGDSPLSYFGGVCRVYGGLVAHILADHAVYDGWDGPESRRFPSLYDLSQQVLKLQTK